MTIIPLRTKDPFLSIDYAKDGEIGTIIKSPDILPAEKSRFGKEQTILPIKLKRDNKTYRLALNATSNDRLVRAFGANGDLWIGQDILIQKRTLTIDGKQKDVLFVTLTEAEEDLE